MKMTLHPDVMITGIQPFLCDYFWMRNYPKFIPVYRVWYQFFLQPFEKHSDYFAMSSSLLPPWHALITAR